MTLVHTIIPSLFSFSTKSIIRKDVFDAIENYHNVKAPLSSGGYKLHFVKLSKK
jgi:hypothetical protein